MYNGVKPQERRIALEKELNEIFAENLTALRTEAKMTQLELGNAISYSDKAISKWERGEAIPDAYVLMSLAKIFGVTVDYMLHDHNGKPRSKRTNYLSIAFLSIIAVFTVFAIAYISVLLASGLNYWLFFVYAGVISLIMITVFNSLWGKPSLNILIVGALVAGIIAMIYAILLPIGNMWQILLLIIPAEAIVICCFKIRIDVKRLLRFAKHEKDEKSQNN